MILPNSLTYFSNDPVGWEQAINNLDDLVPSIRREYADHQQDQTSIIPQQSLLLCFGKSFSTYHGSETAI